MDAHGFDTSDGRMWFHLTRDGRPVRKTFERFLDHNFNPPEGIAKFTKHRQTRGIGFPMITINTAQELRGSIGLETADAAIDQAIETINRYHVKPELRCVMETVGLGGELLDHFDGRTLNPGHAIEGAWFIMAEGKYRGDDSLIRLGCDMLDRTFQLVPSMFLS